MAKKGTDTQKFYMTITAIVAIVAVVGLVMMFTGRLGRVSTEVSEADMIGQAFQAGFLASQVGVSEDIVTAGDDGCEDTPAGYTCIEARRWPGAGWAKNGQLGNRYLPCWCKKGVYRFSTVEPTPETTGVSADITTSTDVTTTADVTDIAGLAKLDAAWITINGEKYEIMYFKARPEVPKGDFACSIERAPEPDKCWDQNNREVPCDSVAVAKCHDREGACFKVPC